LLLGVARAVFTAQLFCCLNAVTHKTAFINHL
jgi:hypothetical protein